MPLLGFATRAINGWNPKSWKANKLNFKKFVLEYNAGGIDLDEEEKEALRKLHAMWATTNKNTPLPVFWEMKELQAAINHTLMFINVNETYVKYNKEFQVWRCCAQMAFCKWYIDGIGNDNPNFQRPTPPPGWGENGILDPAIFENCLSSYFSS